MSKDFLKTKVIKVPIYPLWITFCILSTEGEKYIENKHKGAEARTEKDGQKIHIYLKKKSPLAHVVHELFHATEFIMLEIGQPISPSPNETWAYLIEWLMEEYQKFIKAQQGEVKRV